MLDPAGAASRASAASMATRTFSSVASRRRAIVSAAVRRSFGVESATAARRSSAIVVAGGAPACADTARTMSAAWIIGSHPDLAVVAGFPDLVRLRVRARAAHRAPGRRLEQVVVQRADRVFPVDQGPAHDAAVVVRAAHVERVQLALDAAQDDLRAAGGDVAELDLLRLALGELGGALDHRRLAAKKP